MKELVIVSILKMLTKHNLKLNKKTWFDFGWCWARAKNLKQLDYTFGFEPDKVILKQKKNLKLLII